MSVHFFFPIKEFTSQQQALTPSDLKMSGELFRTWSSSRVATDSGNQGKQGKSPKYFPCWE
ncbi:MAG: hypothetical protein AB2708_14720, partial [Candidatus Thiodiazotropha taylori]